MLSASMSEEEDEDDNNSMRSSLGSLLPATDSPTAAVAAATFGDDSSYVCVRNSIASPPSSLNTVTETMSIGDMVVVGGDAGDVSALDSK